MMDEQEWLQYGIDHDFVWGFCIQHEDGMNGQEAEDRDNADDYCITAFRLKSEYIKGL
jgi:hypothetical protein